MSDQNNCDQYDLERFVDAQRGAVDTALAELRSGRKRSHWMWFIFPQIDGLGSSPMTKRFSIKSLDEARCYIEHPVLGPRLFQCCEALLGLDGGSATEIMGSPDDMKLRSSMTLFERVSESGGIFAKVLDKFYSGKRDDRTLEVLEKLERDPS